MAEIARVARGMEIAIGRHPCWRHPHPILRALRVRGPLPPGYVPRRPAQTVLYVIVRDHLDATPSQMPMQVLNEMMVGGQPPAG